MKKIIFIALIALSFVTANNFANQLNSLFTSVADKGKPSVVSIVSEKSVKQKVHPFFFSPFGQDFPEFEQKGQSLGSGVIINADKVFRSIFDNFPRTKLTILSIYPVNCLV